MNYEGLLWIGLIFASPLIYMLSKTFFTFLINVFSKSEKVTITVDDGEGHRLKKVFYLDRSDDLILLIEELKKNKNNSSLKKYL